MNDKEPGLLTLERFLDSEAELNARHAKAEVFEEPHRRGLNDKHQPEHSMLEILTQMILVHVGYAIVPAVMQQ